MRFSRITLFGIIACVVLGAPAALRAQSSGQIYVGMELDQPPKIANPAKSVRILAEAYPPNLKRAGVPGDAQVQFVVDAQGKVERASVEVLHASTQAFGEAARSAVSKLDFTPGMTNGQAVRTRVLLPIMFR
ncbi:MAG: energy transducer TonB [Gemmatimonadaceae bacterium]